MAKLSFLLVALLLTLLILACVEGDRSRRGKNKSRNRQRDRPEKRRGEVGRRVRPGRTGSEFEFHFPSRLFELDDFDPFAYLKHRLNFGHNRRRPFHGEWHSEGVEDPWFEGPNVCKNETTETDNSTAMGDVFIRHLSSSMRTCDETETMFKCKLVNLDASGTITYTLVYECCHGYGRGAKDYGCPNKIAESDLTEKAEELGLTDFLKAVKMLQLANDLQTGHFTLFVPQNGAFGLDSDLIDAGAGLILKDAPAVIEVSDPAVDKALQSLKNAILSHMVPGIKKTSSLEDDELLQTASPDGATIRINHFYKPEAMLTANCVPILTSDTATNGVIHRVDKVLKPVTQSLLDIIRSRPELSTLKTILASTNYVSELYQDGQLTILAPTNSAFDKMSPYLRDRLLEGDVKCLEKFLLNHLLPNVICAQAVKGKVITSNRLSNNMNVTRTEDNKVFFNDAQVIQSDVMGTNGVLHIIDKALVPDEALGFTDILEKEGLTEFSKLIKKAELHKDLETMKNLSVFAPSNEAIESLSVEVKNKLNEEPDFLKSVVNFHVAQTSQDCRRHLYSGTVTTLANKDVRIHTSINRMRTTKTVECVPMKKSNIDYCGGQINVINSVLIPPEGNVMDVLAGNRNFSKFVSLIKKTSLVDLLQGEGPFTVFAPSNEAFEQIHEETLKKYDENPKALEKFIKYHIVYRDTLCCAAMNDLPWYFKGVKTMAGYNLRMSHLPDGTPRVGHALVTTCDQTATNGYVLGLDQVLLNEPHVPKWRMNPFFDWDDWDI